jgi:hypothetical protein
VNVLLAKASFVKNMGTGSEMSTLMYGVVIVPKPAGIAGTPGKLVGKLTLTLAPE